MAAITNDETLTERQKQALVEIYLSFQQEHTPRVVDGPVIEGPQAEAG